MTTEEKNAQVEHDAVVAEVFGVLSKTGDTVSDAAVENLASWKLGR